METLSVVINCLNEAKHLERLLPTLRGFADEVVVIDMESIDGSVKIAEKYGAKVYSHERLSYVEPARNFGIAKATSKWVLVLDPDEEVPMSLKEKIKEILREPQFDYFRIPRKNIIFGKWVRGAKWWPDYNLRLFRNGSVSWNEMIHSVPMTFGSGTDLPEKEDHAIVHYHYDTVEQFIERLNRYTTENAKSLVKEKYVFSWKDLIVKPVNEFLSRYFMSGGYKEGIHGLALSGLQAFSELVVYLKVWQHGGFEEKNILVSSVIKTIKGAIKDINFWEADTLVKENGSFIQRIKRKFRLP